MDGSAMAELAVLMKMAGPLIFTFLLGFSLQLVNMLVVGHVGAEALAAAALGNMFANASGSAILIGTASACDTLQSQAFGAGNYRRVGAISQRGIVILLLLCGPIGLVWANAGLVLEHLGQDPDTVRLAVVFTRMLIVGLPATAVFEVLKRHLQACSIMVAPMLVTGVAIVFNAIVGYVLVYHTSLSFLGAPLSTALAQWVMLLLMLVYFRYHVRINAALAAVGLQRVATATPAVADAAAGAAAPPHKDGTGSASLVAAATTADAAVADTRTLTGDGDAVTVAVVAAAVSPPAADAGGSGGAAAVPTLSIDAVLDATWTGFSREEALAGWREFILLGIPSATMLLVEWGGFEAAAVISGLLGTTSLAAHTVIATTAALSFMPCLGLSVAAGIRIGQKMGERKPVDARLAYRVVVFSVTVYAFINAGFIGAVHSVWGELFTDDVAVVAMLATWIPLLSVYTLFDALQCACCGVLRGVGRPALAAGANVAAYLVVGLPLSYTLALPAGLGLGGVWLGFVMAVLCAFVFLVGVLHVLNWDREAQKAPTRAMHGLPDAPPPPTGDIINGLAPAAPATSVVIPAGDAAPDFSSAFKADVLALSLSPAPMAAT